MTSPILSYVMISILLHSLCAFINTISYLSKKKKLCYDFFLNTNFFKVGILVPPSSC